MRKKNNILAWLKDCPKDKEGNWDPISAWTAAMKVAHSIDHRGIYRTLETAKCLFKDVDLDIPNDSRGSVMDYISKFITCLKLRGEAKKYLYQGTRSTMISLLKESK